MPANCCCNPCCLTLSHPLDKTKYLQVDIPRSSPFDWEQRLHSNPAITKICVNNYGEPSYCCTEDIEMELAFQLRKYRGRIETIEFTGCRVKELIHLSFATSNYDGDPLLAFVFHNCLIEHRAGKALCLFLQEQCIGELTFEDCRFSDKAVAQWIQDGLSMNRSIRQLKCNHRTMVKGTVLLDMLKSSDKLVKLAFSVSDHDGNFWRLFQSAHDNTSLQYLQLYRTNIDVSAAEAILMRCFVMKSLKELCFSGCDLQQPGLDLLLKTLSHNNHVIDTLTIDDVRGFNREDVPFEHSFGSLQVRKLVLLEPRFGPQTWTRAFNDMANNPAIQCLHIQSSGQLEDVVTEVCDVMLRHNRGPSELILEDIEIVSTILPQVLREGNTSVTSLAVSFLSYSEMESFARDLINMRGLRKLSIKLFDEDEDDFQDNFNTFLDELVRSMESNTFLHTLSFVGFDDKYFSEQHLSKLRYWLAINRVGRHRLVTDPTLSVGMWPHIFANTANEPAGIYFVLRNKPELVVAIPPSRKRKDREENFEI